MKETAQQYTQRMLGYLDGKEPLAVQAATAEKLEQLIAGAPVARLRQRPAPAKWSVNDIIAHLADGEIVGGFRLRLILGAPGTPIVAYDQDAWVTTGAIRGNRRNNFACCGTGISSCCDRSSPISGRTMVSIRSAARNRSSIS